ncbi:MAG: RNA polymerase sigma factor [Candidatus Aminicenantes bacterium]|jgi:RNA polymerase sigma-70 factor (ECF subfamily)|nr:RNA polymerase sigma factor [Candidatus Aminicenantes bacterium]
MKNLQEKTDANIDRDNELIRLLKEGNRQAFTEIIRLYQKGVFKVAYGFFRDRDDAMEIVQETFMRVYEKIDRFGNHSSFKNWVYRIATNLCIDYYRKFKSKKIHSQDISELDDMHSSDTVPPEERLDRQNFKKNLEESLQTLSKRQKMIFVMKHFNALKYKEISGILNISVGTVKSLHHRAARALKKKLAYYEVTS